MYKALYALLVVVWIAIVGGVLYLAARRYRRNRLLRSQGLDPDGQSQTGGVPKRKKKRLLAKDEIQALPVVTLTEDDIQRSKRLAHHRPPPSSPNAVLSNHSHATMSYPLPLAETDPLTTRSSTVAAPSPIPLADKNMLTPTGATSPARAMSAIVNNTLEHSNSDDALALSDQAPLHEENCAVCLEDFNAGEDVRRLPCRHYFHIACIDPWLSERAATCPLCNFDVAQPLDSVSA
ncbi:hypothetical protein GGH94_004087 [Coemansia aciculifera]|uniref:RING-type domain-containing protein n=1 Tax=Coemansia aciculifera TaxID=417176 RepID=A0A9W8IFY2_9FUNG|nr:hypothetical protein GGH94_004087 [Coemansia aciculifera]